MNGASSPTATTRLAASHLAASTARPGAIAVDQNGRRFVNESVNYYSFARSLHERDANTYEHLRAPAWLVFDAGRRAATARRAVLTAFAVMITFTLIGRYILQPSVFEHLGRQERGAGNEIQLTDAMARMIGEQPFHAVTFAGRRFDCGSKAGFVEATLALALEREDLGPEVRRIAERLLAQ